MHHPCSSKKFDVKFGNRLYSKEYDLLPKFLPLHGPGIIVAALKKINVSGCASSKKEKCRSNINSTFLSL